MARSLSISDKKKRDAVIDFFSARKLKAFQYVDVQTMKPVHSVRLIKHVSGTDHRSLKKRFGDGIADALIQGDPEIDLHYTAKTVERATRVYIDAEGEMLYSVKRLMVVTGPDGEEKSRNDFVDVEPTVGSELPPLRWTGRLFPKLEVVTRFALVRSMLLRHVNGLTRDFLFDMAKTLHEADQLMMLGAGPKSDQPLIFTDNGTPFRGFLEGRVQGESYRLVLHLSNLELKNPFASASASAPKQEESA